MPTGSAQDCKGKTVEIPRKSLGLNADKLLPAAGREPCAKSWKESSPGSMGLGAAAQPLASESCGVPWPWVGEPACQGVCPSPFLAQRDGLLALMFCAPWKELES